MEKIDSHIKSPKNEEISKKIEENLSADYAMGS